MQPDPGGSLFVSPCLVIVQAGHLVLVEQRLRAVDEMEIPSTLELERHRSVQRTRQMSCYSSVSPLLLALLFALNVGGEDDVDRAFAWCKVHHRVPRWRLGLKVLLCYYRNKELTV